MPVEAWWQQQVRTQPLASGMLQGHSAPMFLALTGASSDGGRLDYRTNV